MAKERPPELPLAAIRDMLRWFKSARVPGVIIGGVAVSMQGRPRYTRDLDALVIVDHANLPKFIDGAEKFGFSGRIPDVLEFARETRMLLLQHKLNALPLDISLGALEFEEELIRRASIVEVGRLKVPVATPEDLIILKAIADRPQDLADIDNLLTEHSDIDYRYVRRILAGFSEILERPDIIDQIEKLLARHSTRRRR